MKPEEHLAQLGNAYQASCALFAAVELDLFAALLPNGNTLGNLVKKNKWDALRTEALLLALTAEGILQKEQDHYRLSPEYAPHLDPASPQNRCSILRHQARCKRDWDRLEKAVQEGALPHAEEEDDDARKDFILGMADVSRISSEEVADKLDLTGVARMLDLGGGPGTAGLAFARRCPGLEVTLMDLPPVIPIAREVVEKAGLADRFQFHPGNFLEDDLGEGYDLVYLSNVIHMLGMEETRQLLEKASKALNPGGRVVVKDFFLEPSRHEPVFAAYFNLHMALRTEKGRCYTREEVEAMTADFSMIPEDFVSIATHSGLFIAHK